MRVSAIIPTYNRLNFLKEAIKSVVDQTYSNIELIIVDDGSSDQTGEYLTWLMNTFFSVAVGCAQRSLLKKHSSADHLGKWRNLVILTQKNLGVSHARNRGIEKATGELIAFLDSDDVWEPEKIERQVAFFKSTPDAMICQTEEIWIRKGKRINLKLKHKKHSGWIFEKCIPLCIVSPSAVMMRRELFDAIGLFDEELLQAEDYDLWLRTSLRYPIYLIDDPLVIKRGGHEDQLSAKWGIDQYRVRSLEKVLKDPKLSKNQAKLVLDELNRRCKILAAGFAKRRGSAESPPLE